MSETMETPTETSISRAQGGNLPTAQSGPSTRIYRIAAGVGIAVGCVIITGAIFVFGLLIGSQWGSGWSDGGYDGSSEADWDMSAFDPDDDGAWGTWTFPDDGGTAADEPVAPTTSPPVPGR
jgi:hypothetical protein